MLSVCETIVAFGFIKYIVSQSTIKARRVQLLSKSTCATQDDVDTISSRCTTFVETEIKKVRQILSEKCMQVSRSSSMSDVESKKWTSMELVNMVKNDALENQIPFSVSNCSDTRQGIQEIATSFYLGLFPDEPGKGVYPGWKHFVSQRKPWFLQNVKHAVNTQYVLEIADEFVDIASPISSQPFHKYLEEWIPSIPSWNSSILHVCQIEAVAPVDNSNGISESNFRFRKSNKELKLSSRDAGLYVHKYQQRSLGKARRLLHDINAVCNFAEIKNKKKSRQLMNTECDLKSQVAEENRRDHVWKKNNPVYKKMDVVCLQLHNLLEIEDQRISQMDRYKKVKEYLQKVGALKDIEGNVIVQHRSFHNWLARETGRPKFLRFKNTRDALEQFAKILTVQRGDSQPLYANLNTVSLLKCDGGYNEVIEIARGLHHIEYHLLLHPEETRIPSCVGEMIQKFVGTG